VHLVGFIIRIFHDARSPERQILYSLLRKVERGVIIYSTLSQNAVCSYLGLMVYTVYLVYMVYMSTWSGGGIKVTEKLKDLRSNKGGYFQ